ncbi:hypothetical protein [Leisingera sp. ANG-M7]|uniref:hypothetical protein n=1 Tax=Leisingera sp. ANG-M7 TaxID=1577902 RepID=UPI000AAE146E|nr:hypothetical protein [Leisingera sp. ANG-M7]
MKCMGLNPREKVQRICQIRITSTSREPLNAITAEDCAREGFPEYAPADFVNMLAAHRGCPPDEPVNRIEFEFLD